MFLIWPFLTLIIAIANFRDKWARSVIFLFLVYYGLTFVIGNVGVDAERYALNLKRTAEIPFSHFFKILGGLYTNTSVDIVEPFVTFVVSRFTDHHSLLFGTWAAIFAFFYLKSIRFLHSRFSNFNHWNTYFMMFFFIMIVPVTSLGGVRMPIATWIFFYGACNVIMTRNPSFFIITLAASLVHWSFLTANVVLLLYYILGNRNLIYLPIVLLSFIVPNLLAPFFHVLSLKSGDLLQARYKGYSNEEYILNIQESYESASWFMGLSENLVFYYLLLIIIITRLSYRSQPLDKAIENMYSFLLLFLSVVNFGQVIPTFGVRFQVVFFLFATFYIILSIKNLPIRKITFLTLLGLVPMLLYIAIVFRIGSESINLWIFAPGFGTPFFMSDVSVADILFN